MNAQIRLSPGGSQLMFQDEAYGDMLIFPTTSNQAIRMGVVVGEKATMALHSNVAVVNGMVAAGGVNTQQVTATGLTLGLYDPAYVINGVTIPPGTTIPYGDHNTMLTVDTSDAHVLSTRSNAVMLTNNPPTTYKLLSDLTIADNGKVLVALNMSGVADATVAIRDAGDTTTVKTVSVPPSANRQFVWYGASWYA